MWIFVPQTILKCFFPDQTVCYQISNCSKLFNAQYSAYKSCLVRNPYYSSFVWPWIWICFSKIYFFILVFVLENAEGNFLHDSASRVLRFQLREWALLRIWSWHFNNSVQMTGLVCRHAVWLNIFLYSL